MAYGLRKVPLIFPFLLCFTQLIILATFPSGIALCPLLPFLSFAFPRLAKIPSLYLSVLCGFLTDLLAGGTPLGLYTLSYCATAFITYPHRRHFFEERALGMFSYTAFISFVYSLCTYLFMRCFGHPIPFAFKGVFTSFIFMPFCDALFAFCFFTSPLMLYTRLRKKWRSLA